ncbi:glycosyltransferase family protein [Komagataeibacter oboediens]
MDRRLSLSFLIGCGRNSSMKPYFDKLRGGVILPLVVCVFVALVVRILMIFLSPGPLRADEFFQYMEPAYYKLTGHGVLTWEWQAGIRSWLLPDMIAQILKAGHALGLGYSTIFVRIVFALCSLGLVAGFVYAGWVTEGISGAWICGMSAALWPDMVNDSFRTLGETVSGNIMALSVLIIYIAMKKQGKAHVGFPILFAFGLLTGLSFAFRFHLAPALCLEVMIVVWLTGARSVLPVAAGLLLPVCMLGLVDYQTLGHPFQSIYKNFYLNVNEGVALRYGSMPAVFYPFGLFHLWGAAFLPLCWLFWKGMPEHRYMASIPLFILLYHSMISHKEISFVYAAIPILVLVASFALSKMARSGRAIHLSLLVGSLAIVELGVLASSYADAIHKNNRIMALQVKANKMPDMCGLALVGQDGGWWLSGGYSHMKPNRALYLLSDMTEGDVPSTKYNYVIGGDGYNIFNKDSQKIICKNDVCLYHVNSTCDGAPDYTQFSRTVVRMNR